MVPSFKGQLVLAHFSWKRIEGTDQEGDEERIDETPSVLAWQLQPFQVREGETAAGLDLHSWKSSGNTPFSSCSVFKSLEKPAAAAAVSPGQT